jgi:transcription initiation factor TFIIIB Brf1 subunit/transcription initiation factor TFIIB
MNSAGDKMNMREKIVETIQQADFEYKHTGEGPSSYALADVIMAAFTGETTHGKSQE